MHPNLNPILDVPQQIDTSCGYLSCLLSLPQIVSDGPNHSHLSPATSLPWTGHQNKVRRDLPLARDLMVQPAKGGEKSETRLWASEKRSFCFPLWFTGWQTLTQENKKELRGRAVKKKKGHLKSFKNKQDSHFHGRFLGHGSAWSGEKEGMGQGISLAFIVWVPCAGMLTS